MREPAPAPARAAAMQNEVDAAGWAAAVRRYIVHLLPLESSPGRNLLDLACGMGHLAALAKARGWRVTAIDASPLAVSAAALRFGLDARAGTLARHREALGRFDAVLIDTCLDSADDPAALFRDVRTVLSTNGRVCIDAPLVPAGTTPGHASPTSAAPGDAASPDTSSEPAATPDALRRLLAECGYADIVVAAYREADAAAQQSRPLLRRWVDRLPRAIAGFVGRSLDRLIARGRLLGRLARWLGLGVPTACTLEDAVAQIQSAAACARPINLSTPTGDRLLATATRLSATTR